MAKMIIDIPDAVIDDIKATYEGLDVVYDAVKFGKVLPYRATNGDVIQNVCSMWIVYHDTDVEVTVSKEEWNAPYNPHKVGDTDGNIYS